MNKFLLSAPALLTASLIVASSVNVTDRLLSRAAEAVTPPYSNSFDTEESVNDFTAWDVNGDEQSWYYDGDGAVMISLNYDIPLDDWLVAPPVQLEEGKMYKVSFSTWSAGGEEYPERIEARYGTERSLDGLNCELIAPTVVSTMYDAPLTLSGYRVAKTTCTYHVGIHACSDAGMYELFVDNFSIGAALSTSAPAAPSDVKAEADLNGGMSVTVSFTAPAVAVNGEAIDAISRIDVTRNGENVHTFTAPAVGVALSWTDNDVPEAGDYTYSVTACNADGEGLSASATCHVGFNKPAPVTNLRIVETATPGEVTLTWDAPATDIDGKTIDPSTLTYNIYAYDIYGDYSYPLEGYITECTHTFQATDGSDVEFVNYCVDASNSEGYSDLTASGYIAVGITEEMPFYESAMVDHKFIIIESGIDATWGIGDYANYNISSADADNRFFVFQAEAAGADASLMFGKIRISGNNPTLSFQAFKEVTPDGQPSTNEIRIDIISNGITETLATIKLDELSANNTWNLVSIPLDKYADRTIQPVFTGICRNMDLTFIDAVNVWSPLDHNLSVTGVKAPEKVVADTPFAVTATVNNIGAHNADSWKAELYLNGESVATLPGSMLKPGESKPVAFDCKLPVSAPSTCTYTVKVVYDADMDPVDNSSEEIQVLLSQPNHPVVVDLSATTADGTVTLSWSAPDPTDTFANPVTDDAESYASFAETNVGGWTFVDNDRAAIGGFQGMDIPGIEAGTQHSFFVFDNSVNPFNTGETAASFSAHSGHKYFAAMYNDNLSALDDWLISPALGGCAQTVTMWLRSYDPYYPENIEIYYTTSDDTATDGFEFLGSVSDIPQAWTLLSFELPAGSKRFAVRAITEGGYMLLIDDITYIPAGKGDPLSIIGYNVYRDGKRLNSEPLTATGYVDNEVADGEHTYNVTTIFDRGESSFSNDAIANLDKSAISLPSTDITAITVNGSVVTVNAPADSPVTICTAAGIVTATSVGALEVDVAPGIYIVTVGNRSSKILVK